MKNHVKLLSFLFVLTALFACTKEDPKPDPDPDPDPKQELVELTGNLTTRTLTADKQYLLKGQVFVRDGQVLTVEPGTIIYGDKATRATLIIDKGGRMIAEGTVDKPIVMTSAQPVGVRDRGDWGGLVILGRANVNQPNPAIEGITPEVNFGTLGSSQFDEESSGIFKYFRVEFGGIELTPNNETNSITMGGVGRGTIMEYAMVSFGGDDGFEWFGGCNNGKYLISLAMWDDDMDCDFGWSGNVQYGLVVRYPGFADQSQSNAFECDNGPNDNDVEPYTTGTFSNITVFGPIKEGDRVGNNNYYAAMDLRRRTAISITNSVLTGFPTGLRMNQPSVVGQYESGRGVLFNNVLLAPRTIFAAGSGVEVSSVQALWEANNEVQGGAASISQYQALGLNPDLFYGTNLPDAYPSNPNFAVSSGSLLTGASFDNPKFNEPNRAGFFDTNVSFRGGFGSTDWTDQWTEFNPILKDYSK
jgi:hypothetical protein